MKNIKELAPIAILGAFLCLMLAGCQRVQTNAAGDRLSSTNSIRVYIDTNGCQYLLYTAAYRGGITARMRPDGQQECGQ